ncbi:hypothetical protein CPB84DRAFT_1938169 [Gymnopilus junonius]|uniref:Uncharacterized protein n=1 Tax=Gymnopilus junonius TaxID=109634 RepID=A0A9P5NK48_GYMJU|nr:hypothetical protein CPB84DRAFT_1938169 [Gymnopilus junonius]
MHEHAKLPPSRAWCEGSGVSPETGHGPVKQLNGLVEPLHGLEISDSQLQARAGQQRLSAQKNQEKKQQNELAIDLLTWPGLPLHRSALHVQPPSSQRTHAHIPQKRGGACSHGPKGEREERKRGRRKGSGGVLRAALASEPILARKSNMITGITACCPRPSIYGLYYLIDVATVTCSNLRNLSKSVPLRLQNLILKAEDL